jgi:hypothetical protein
MGSEKRKEVTGERVVVGEKKLLEGGGAAAWESVVWRSLFYT